VGRLPLVSQPYQGKSLIASGQEAVNVYGEINGKPSPGDPQAPVPVTWYPFNGTLNRPRANCCMFAYGANLIGDWENGKLYQIDPNEFTDFGGPLTHIKTFAHILDDDLDRIGHLSFDADMECGTTKDLNDDPQVLLSWSDDRGRTYGNAIGQSLGQTGQYLTTISWNRLGYARDRVYKLQWSAPVKTALNGGFASLKKART